jgi:hypothetical protein
MAQSVAAARRVTRIFLLLIFLGGQFCVARDMPGQSGLNEINGGNTAINHGKACDQSERSSGRQNAIGYGHEEDAIAVDGRLRAWL